MKDVRCGGCYGILGRAEYMYGGLGSLFPPGFVHPPSLWMWVWAGLYLGYLGSKQHFMSLGGTWILKG